MIYIHQFVLGERKLFVRTDLLPECRCSILEASPTANLKSPVYNTFPWEPSNRNLHTQKTHNIIFIVCISLHRPL